MEFPTPEYLEDRIKYHKQELDLLWERYSRMFETMIKAAQSGKYLEYEVASWCLKRLKTEIMEQLKDA